jgi:acyl-CoA hydrolase
MSGWKRDPRGVQNAKATPVTSGSRQAAQPGRTATAEEVAAELRPGMSIEYGVGISQPTAFDAALTERLLISIAHPDFRDEFERGLRSAAAATWLFLRSPSRWLRSAQA